ncbi:hypothetical protein AMECASPLE_025359 [Ameca splendens]|uniref:Uncharacterized protein n=1 Tax=Ameca splendens TaxID=208324 RepID=A0ABV0ZQ66_9TELE
MLHLQPSPLKFRRKRTFAEQRRCAAQRAERGTAGGGHRGATTRQQPSVSLSLSSAFCWKPVHWMLDLFLIRIWIGARDNFAWDKTRLLSRLPAICFARRVDDGSVEEGRNRRLPEERN